MKLKQQQLVALAGIYNPISHPRAHNISALLKFTVSYHHHFCDAKVLQWQAQLPLEALFEIVAVFQLVFYIRKWRFLFLAQMWNIQDKKNPN